MSHRDAAAAAKEETMSDTQNTPPFPDTEPASMNGAAAPADTSEALARVAELEAKNVELADAYLRAKAEMENIRRRADEEVAKSRKFAVESFAESLLPVCDSLHAAIAAQSAGQGTPEQLLEGVQATLRQLSQALERNKVLEEARAAVAEAEKQSTGRRKKRLLTKIPLAARLLVEGDNGHQAASRQRPNSFSFSIGMPVSDPGGFKNSPSSSTMAISIGQIAAHCGTL